MHSNYREPTHGIPPLRMAGPMGGFGEVLWEPNESNPFAIQQMRQVILMKPDGERVQVALPRNIRTAREFDNYLARFGLGVFGDARLVGALIEPDEMDWLRRVAHHYLLNVKTTSVVEYSSGSGNVPTKTTVQLSPLYYRAIAKIGFHFLLNSCPSLTGREVQFDLLRSFVISGAGSYGQLLTKTDNPKAFRFTRVKGAAWIHIMGYHQTGSTLTVDIALFANVWVPFIAWEISVSGLLLPEGSGSVCVYKYWRRGKPRLHSGSHGELIRVGNQGLPDLGVFPLCHA